MVPQLIEAIFLDTRLSLLFALVAAILIAVGAYRSSNATDRLFYVICAGICSLVALTMSGVEGKDTILGDIILLSSLGAVAFALLGYGSARFAIPRFELERHTIKYMNKNETLLIISSASFMTVFFALFGLVGLSFVSLGVAALAIWGTHKRHLRQVRKLSG